MEAKSVMMIRGRWILVWVLLGLLLIPFGCSSGGGGSDGGGGIAAEQVKLSLENANQIARANGEDGYILKAQVLDKYGVGIGGMAVSMAVVGAKGVVAFDPGSRGTTSEDGTYTVTVTNTCSEDDFFVVRANAGGKSAEHELRFFATPVPTYLGLSLSQTTVKSDNSDAAEITATVLDASRAPIENITVAFQTSVEGFLTGGGQISASSAVTDENGKATIEFRSGTIEKKNQTVTVEAWVPAFMDQEGLRKMIPVQVIGTTVSLATEKTNLVIDPSSPARALSQLTITVRDAGGNPINDAEVVFEQIRVDGDLQGEVTVTPSAGRTNVNGNLVVTVNGITSGTINLVARSMGAQAGQVYNIGRVGEIFSIESPVQRTVRMTTQKCLKIQVKAPNTSQVQFATSMGSFVGSQCCVCNDVSEFCDYLAGCVDGERTTVANVDSNNMATVYLRSSSPGIANVVAMDVNNPETKDSLTVVISETVAMAARLALGSSATVVAPSIGTTENTSTLTVSVRNANNEPVTGVPVAFSIENPTGGGEKVSPVIVFTGETGMATSIFTSGALNSGPAGVTVKAKVIRNAGEPEVSDTVVIHIARTVSSIEFGRGTEIQANETETMYLLPMSLIVTDFNGNPISGAVVSLSTWPVHYATGYRDIDDDCAIVYTGWHNNEDVNRNLSMDPGEDLNGDGSLTPPVAAAGTLPETVTTGENGSVEFLLIYPKSSAGWIRTEITASTVVSGLPTRSSKTLTLPWLEGEECNLPNAPYDPPIGYYIVDVATIRISASSATGLEADGISSYSVTARILDFYGNPVMGREIAFTAPDVGGGKAVIDPQVGISNDEGIVTAGVKYFNCDGGSIVVRASSEGKNADIILHYKVVTNQNICPGPADEINTGEQQMNLQSEALSIHADTGSGLIPSFQKELSENDNNVEDSLKKSQIGPGLLREGDFKIESSLWNLPGFAYGNRMTQIVGFFSNDSIDPELFEGIPVFFISDPLLTIENGNFVLGADGKAMTIGKTQLLSIQQESAIQEKTPKFWEKELMEYVTETYQKQFLGFPGKGLCNVSAFVNQDKAEASEKAKLAESTILISGQPIILFDRDSFSLENGESETVKVLICDENLNPLSPGTTVKIDMNHGSVTGRVENTYQNTNNIGPDIDEHLKLIEYRLNISDSDPLVDVDKAAVINVNVSWEGISIRSRLDGFIR